MNATHERLSSAASTYDVDDRETYPIRGVAIGEGDVTRGQSEKKTRWDAEVLRDAADRLAGEQAKVLKGRPGDGHKPMDEQADPEEIIGAVEYEYQDGLGLTYSGEILDEGIARRIDLGLVDVSPDIWRRLGEQNADGVHEVEEIVDVPYLTILDRGAADGATVEMAGEALAPSRLAEFLDGPVDAGAEQLQRDEDPAGEPAPDVGDAVRWRSDAAGAAGGWRYGVVVDGLQDGPEDSVLVAVYEPTDDGWENRDEQTPIAVDSLVPIGSNGVGSLPAASDVRGGSEQAAETTGAATGDGSSSDSPVDPTPDMSDQELQEQLAEVKSERDGLEEQVDDLAAEVDDLENEVDEKSDALAEKDDRIDDLEEEVEPFKEMLAEIVAGDSVLDASTIAERYELSELVDQLAEDVEEDDDRDYTEIVREQLSGTPSPRGEGADEDDPGGLSDGDAEQADQLARSVMDLADVQNMSERDVSPREYLADRHGVDAAEYENEVALRQAVENGGEA